MEYLVEVKIFSTKYLNFFEEHQILNYTIIIKNLCRGIKENTVRFAVETKKIHPF